MTVMGQDAGEIYKNQGQLKSQLAAAAGVRPGQIYFYNQTANSDARTGVTAMSVSRGWGCVWALLAGCAGGWCGARRVQGSSVSLAAMPVLLQQ
jgi:hypothetical protein